MTIDGGRVSVPPGLNVSDPLRGGVGYCPVPGSLGPQSFGPGVRFGVVGEREQLF